MKVFVYRQREDEIDFFKAFGKKYNLDISYTSEYLTKENAHWVKGCEAVNITAESCVDKEIIAIFKEYGVKYLVTRTAGFNHIDLEAAKTCGIKAANVPSYSPNAISEHTLTLALSLMRNLKSVLKRVEKQDFRLQGLRAREIRNMTIGIVGTGKIGYEVIKAFKALGATVIAYDLYPNKKVKAYAEYVSLEELYAKSDIISFHCPFTPENYHFINEKTIGQMKDGVYLINTARGELFDYEAVYQGLNDNKIGALAFDVYENEEEFIRYNLQGKEMSDELFKKLTTMEQVLFTPHVSFYTDEAVSNMVEYSLENIHSYFWSESCKNELLT